MDVGYGDTVRYIGPQDGAVNAGDLKYVTARRIGTLGCVEAVEPGCAYVAWTDGSAGWEPRGYVATEAEWRRWDGTYEYHGDQPGYSCLGCGEFVAREDAVPVAADGLLGLAVGFAHPDHAGVAATRLAGSDT